MKRWITARLTLCCLVFLAAAAAWAAQQAPERLASDEIGQLAGPLQNGIEERIQNPPVAVAINADQAFGFKANGMPVMVVLPDKNLTAAAVEGAGEKPVPVGIIATHDISVIVKDKPVPFDQLNVLEFGDVKVPIFFVAVRKKGDDRVLEVYSKEKTPLATVTLKPATADKAALAVAFENLNAEKKQADLVLTLGGAYRGTVRIGMEG